VGEGLAMQYTNHENFSSKMHNLFALVFCVVDEIPGAFNEIKPHLLEEASEVTDWF
jgi:hypothetical protein